MRLLLSLLCLLLPFKRSASSLEARIKQLEEKIDVLEQEKRAVQGALEQEQLSEKEPNWVTRLKALEYESAGYHSLARKVETLEDIEASLTLSNVIQRVDLASASENYHNYRFDASLGLPAGEVARKKGSLFFHLRAGQSPEQNALPQTFTGLNASAFQLGGTSLQEDSSLTLVEAWYQLDIPLDKRGGTKSRHWLTWNIGKMDPFIFFDQNAVANDEATQFLSSPFVHNAILDNPIAAEIGTDSYGAAPGLRLAYRYERSNEETIGVSAAMLGSHDDASYRNAFASQFSIFQTEWNTQFWGRKGHYRAYLWKNDKGPTFDAATATQKGWGLSFDQQVEIGAHVFLRYAEASGSRLAFDKVLSVGVEFSGEEWLRSRDSLGIAWGLLTPSDDFRQATLVSSSARVIQDEHMVEAYYRYQLSEQFHLTPNIAFPVS